MGAEAFVYYISPKKGKARYDFVTMKNGRQRLQRTRRAPSSQTSSSLPGSSEVAWYDYDDDQLVSSDKPNDNDRAYSDKQASLTCN